jgi:gamma-glutamyl hercynylcysteine S-oxide synthase
MGQPLSGAALLVRHGAEPLPRADRPGHAFTRADGYVAPLVAYTHEDREAKGLRKLEDPEQPRAPVHFTALELARDEPALLLLAPVGGGKSSFALDLALSLAGEKLGDARFNLARLARRVARNDMGLTLPEAWGQDVPTVLYWALEPGDDPTTLTTDGEPALLILDNAEDLGPAGPARLAALMRRAPALRLLALGESEACRPWAPPPGMAVHALCPTTATPAAPVARVPEQDGFAAWCRGERRAAPHLSQGPRALQTAAFLARHEPRAIAALLKEDAALWRLPVMLAAPWVADRAALGLALAATGAPGAVLGAQIARDPAMIPALHAALVDPALPAHQRDLAGRHLAALGDPRDLDALIPLPGGRLTMGGATHPNASPAHQIDIAPFRIGRFPVSNRLYGAFAAATSRPWRSSEGTVPERANAPAVDLTWHDARAFCLWLTGLWREQGRIAGDEQVRLPSEPEWEYAARGAQGDPGQQEVYPWGTGWAPDRANGLEAGFNTTTALGLFPAGASPFGVEDMTGQVWEWTSTLWGIDPARPARPYPWHPEDDAGDEAPAHIRRVLRGGCFSSHRDKATCTYRGSLEPGGFWRGNGFRIAVSR